MIDLLILVRTLYFLKHNCHNLVSRISFFADHGFLGDSYEKTLSHYDSLVERIIGLGYIPDLVAVQINAAAKLKSIPISYKDNVECFQVIYNFNKMILNLIEQLCKNGNLSEGTYQFIGTLADEIEKEQYLIGQRIKGK